MQNFSENLKSSQQKNRDIRNSTVQADSHSKKMKKIKMFNKYAYPFVPISNRYHVQLNENELENTTRSATQ